MPSSRTKTFESARPLAPGNVYLGVDQSLTGFAVAAVSTPSPAGLAPEQYYSEVYRSAERGVDRLHDISEFLRGFIVRLEERDCQVVDAAMENTVRASHSASVLGELSGVVKMTFREHAHSAVRYPILVPPTTLKKYVTGRGNATKLEVVTAVNVRLRAAITDDNATDALALAFIAAQHYQSPEEFALLVGLFASDPRNQRG